MMSAEVFLLANGAFLLAVVLCLGWAQWRTRPGPAFPGPRPVGRLFKAWLVVIWGVGLLLPLVALVIDGFMGEMRPVRLALGWYLLMFVVQVGCELFVWKRWRSPVWVLVPCLFLPWRLFQVGMGFYAVQGLEAPLTVATLWGLAGLWIVNIGVHYSNIPNTLRWDAHPADATFPALKDPRVFVEGAQ
ncbi:hypothetical protein [Sandaracinobacteroides saxicola]|uniref:Uncharacterized protein n=1 Tax=Sandaracinobacteroides saxicola TaxID=2759707 RepID=A0A7G5IL83_9SPHN|nr:hypothetical protein [Sandaracinobacteroides saxicola]QMW24125.1 hypothetical protein H3309_06620 [Sandaracinobacteroides saxicola]